MLWAHFGGSEVRRFHRLPYFHISRLVVEGNQRIPRQVIIDRLRLPPQASVLDVDLHDLAARLMVDPWIQRAAVSRRLPSGLTVRVWERRPVAVVVSDRPYLVSDDALVLTETTLQEAVGLPVVRLGVRRPPTVGEEIDASRLARCTRVWRRVGEEAPGLATVLREVRLEGDGSFTILLTGGMPYLRVREEGLSESLERLREVVGIRGRHLRELEYVDLRFGDRVIVRPVGKGGEA
jgi:cell division protein FtsQ